MMMLYLNFTYTCLVSFSFQSVLQVSFSLFIHGIFSYTPSCPVLSDVIMWTDFTPVLETCANMCFANKIQNHLLTLAVLNGELELGSSKEYLFLHLGT